MSLLTRTTEVFWGLLDPWLFVGLSIKSLPGTILTLIQERRFGVLLSPSGFRDAWFSRFWGSVAGPGIRANAGEHVIPLLQGRASGGVVRAEQVEQGISGTVIEVGAGSGLWADVYKVVAEVRADPEAETGNEGAVRRRNAAGERVITRIYGVEPNKDQHPNLRNAVAAAGLEDVYRIVPVGIEDLDNSKKWDGRVEKGSVDCIVTILCLCSIPEPEKNIRELYKYLKKGGRWYVYEHVKCEHGWGMKLYQRESYSFLSTLSKEFF